MSILQGLRLLVLCKTVVKMGSKNFSKQFWVFTDDKIIWSTPWPLILALNISNSWPSMLICILRPLFYSFKAHSRCHMMSSVNTSATSPLLWSTKATFSEETSFLPLFLETENACIQVYRYLYLCVPDVVLGKLWNFLHSVQSSLLSFGWKGHTLTLASEISMCKHLGISRCAVMRPKLRGWSQFRAQPGSRLS